MRILRKTKERLMNMTVEESEEMSKRIDEFCDAYDEEILNEVCKEMGIEPMEETQEFFMEDNMFEGKYGKNQI
ncbi:hypothetical protein KQI68_07075 [Peptoniphilus sp. MSJ-1]|uniref:Nif11 domain-containing protein n=1 Tax=Peptoniphilus ovalis TaxID=2841503 RepID=A0ABS6FK72_9FIRM|nr:hypothetical protein [Peptoniphilus ovalis]MBU5669600.1 hypothetical protein [Peptoniphilus ovalis]